MRPEPEGEISLVQGISPVAALGAGLRGGIARTRRRSASGGDDASGAITAKSCAAGRLEREAPPAHPPHGCQPDQARAEQQQAARLGNLRRRLQQFRFRLRLLHVHRAVECRAVENIVRRRASALLQNLEGHAELTVRLEIRQDIDPPP